MHTTDETGNSREAAPHARVGPPIQHERRLPLLGGTGQLVRAWAATRAFVAGGRAAALPASLAVWVGQEAGRSARRAGCLSRVGKVEVGLGRMGRQPPRGGVRIAE